MVRWCKIHLLCLPTMTLVGRHVLRNIKNKLLESSVQESVFPYSLCYVVYVHVICSPCYLSVMIQLVSFPLSQYDLQLYALELFGQEWLDTPTFSTVWVKTFTVGRIMFRKRLDFASCNLRSGVIFFLFLFL